jgi:hypothetical protein
MADEFSSSSSEDSGEESATSLPELHELENKVFQRYQTYHPKELIPIQEKSIALHLRCFNDIFFDEEEEYENKLDSLLQKKESLESELKAPSLSKKKKKNLKNQKNQRNENKLKELNKINNEMKEIKLNFLKKKDQLEKYYAFLTKNAVENHPDPPPHCLSILKLLEKNSSTLHAITLHLSFFSYIDSDLEDDSEGELADMEDEDEFEDDLESD